MNREDEDIGPITDYSFQIRAANTVHACTLTVDIFQKLFEK